MEERFRKFMQGRYGADELSRDLVRLALALLLIGLLLRRPFISGYAFFMTAYAWFRIFSKNHTARGEERRRYLPFRARLRAPWQKIRNRWNMRKAHRVFRCESCKTQMKVPKGKGSVRITCPSCGHQFTKRT